MPRTSAGVSEVYRLHHICPSLPAFLVQPVVEVTSCCVPFFIGVRIFVGEKQVFALFIPTWDVSFAAPSRDVLTGGVQQHFTVVIIGFIEVGGSRQWQSCSNCFHFFLEVGPVRFAKVPSPDRSSPDSLDK